MASRSGNSIGSIAIAISIVCHASLTDIDLGIAPYARVDFATLF